MLGAYEAFEDASGVDLHRIPRLKSSNVPRLSAQLAPKDKLDSPPEGGLIQKELPGSTRAVGRHPQLRRHFRDEQRRFLCPCSKQAPSQLNNGNVRLHPWLRTSARSPDGIGLARMARIASEYTRQETGLVPVSSRKAVDVGIKVRMTRTGGTKTNLYL